MRPDLDRAIAVIVELETLPRWRWRRRRQLERECARLCGWPRFEWRLAKAFASVNRWRLP